MVFETQGDAAGDAMRFIYQVKAVLQAQLDALCSFFRTDPASVRSMDGFLIRGTTQTLTLPQLAFVFQCIQKSLTVHTQPQDQVFPDATELLHSDQWRRNTYGIRRNANKQQELEYYR